MKLTKNRTYLLCAILLSGLNIQAQPSKPTLGNEMLDFKTPTFNLQLVKSSQTVSELRPTTVPDFDFTPHDRIEKRSAEGFYHLGDLNLRVRKISADKWINCSTAANRAPVVALSPKNDNVLVEANLTSILPDSLPLQVIRKWKKEGDQLVLSFELTNNSNAPVEIGALGIPMIFNNDMNGKDLDQAHAQNVFYDPYIGMDAGYLQVVRLSGDSPVLLVVPEGKTPFEAYRPLLDDPTRRGITFEGFHEWMVHSKAYADQEWKGVEEWNAPTSKQLQPGEKYTIGLRFILTDKVENIEKALIANKRPVAVGIPGYVLPQDVKAKLFLSSPEQVSSIKTEPEGALEINKQKPTNDKWTAYEVQGKTWGRARLIITYADGVQQSINYKIIKPEKQVVADNGHFLTTKQWFDQPDTLFHRSPSVITYDYEKQQQVTQDPRAWICGLSDEGGAGSWLNAIMKQLVEPNPQEIKKMESFVNQTLWGGIQYNKGAHKYGVRKSMFYYEPDS
ncbi:MAG TPA: DUF5695 domain-containing protein, partial [Sunxiuqinia sp.]|nr:DUF5695 domain-containing protein [Sunxiuqinia sp.]